MSQIINSFFYERYVYISQTCFHPFLNPGQRASHTLPLIENGDKTKMRDKKNDKNNQVFFFFSSMFPNGFCKDNSSSQLTAPFLLQLFCLQSQFSTSVFYLGYGFFTLFQREKKRAKLTISCMLRREGSLELF